MSEIVDQSLQKIAKGTGIIFIGMIGAMLFGFAGRVIIARYFTQSEYGIYSLALVVMSILATLSTLGLQDGATRQIAFYRGKGDTPKVRGIVLSALQLAVIASVALSLILFSTSALISIEIFHSPELSAPLKILSIAIPFSVLISIFASIFRGFDNVGPTAYFQNILRSALFPLILIVFSLFALPFLSVFYAYMASIVLTCIVFAIYAIKKSPLPTSTMTKKIGTAMNPIRKELLLFSLPLLTVVTLTMIMTWTDTLMLGYFKTSEVVGLYNAALPLAQLIPATLVSVSFIYLPIISQLYSHNLIEQMKRNYQVLTKWILFVSFPIFLLLFLFPEAILGLLFGTQYVEAALALRILSAGLMFNTFLGPNGVTLLVMGKRWLMMWSSLLAVSLNMIFNIILIPQWGIVGAAVASLISYFAGNIFSSVKLYQLSRIHPFTKNYLKPIAVSIIIASIIYGLTKIIFAVVPFWLLPILLITFLLLYGLSILLTRSFDKEDIMLLHTIEKRFGANATIIKAILKRFM